MVENTEKGPGKGISMSALMPMRISEFAKITPDEGAAILSNSRHRIKMKSHGGASLKGAVLAIAVVVGLCAGGVPPAQASESAQQYAQHADDAIRAAKLTQQEVCRRIRADKSAQHVPHKPSIDALSTAIIAFEMAPMAAKCEYPNVHIQRVLYGLRVFSWGRYRMLESDAVQFSE